MSSTEQTESRPAIDEAHPEHRRGNGFATAALALGVAGVTLVTIVPGVVFGVLGLRRAASCGAGRMRSWLGIGPRPRHGPCPCSPGTCEILAALLSAGPRAT